MAWCPQKTQKGEWIQVSKEEPSMWTDLIIQGRGDSDHWVTGIKVAYTLNGHEWKLVEDGRVFSAAFNQNSKKRITFDNPVFARALRIFP